jgi:hypothetical protein
VFELHSRDASRTNQARHLAVDVTGRVAHAIMDSVASWTLRRTRKDADQGEPARSCPGCGVVRADGRPAPKVLEEQGLLRATGKTIVVFTAPEEDAPGHRG